MGEDRSYLDDKVLPARLICSDGGRCHPQETGEDQWTCPVCLSVYRIDPLRLCWELDKEATEAERSYGAGG